MSSAASDVYKRQLLTKWVGNGDRQPDQHEQGSAGRPEGNKGDRASETEPVSSSYLSLVQGNGWVMF